MMFREAHIQIHLATTILALVALGTAACDKPSSSQKPTSPSAESTEQAVKIGRKTESKTTKAVSPSGFLKPSEEDITEAIGHITTMKNRKLCNRVMGCRPSIQLAGLGTATEAAIIRVLSKEKGSDGYWVIKCIDLLGQLGRDASAKFLVSLLDDKRTEVRTRAALSLARLSAASTKDAVLKTYEDVKDGPDLGFRIALLYAIDRIGPFSVERRKQTAALLPKDKAGLGQISPLHLITAAEVAKEWPIPEALESLRITAAHIGPFIRRNSIEALGRMKDTGSIPVLIGRMTDQVPSIRAAAMRALRSITGNSAAHTEQDWITWCEKRTCRATTKAK